MIYKLRVSRLQTWGDGGRLRRRAVGSSEPSHVSITASHRTHMLRSVIALAAVASSSAFSLLPLRGGSTTPRSSPQMAEIGETGVAFETVAREWRCKYTRALSLSLSLSGRIRCAARPRDAPRHAP